MKIERLSKDKVMRPSLIDSVDKVNEVIDTVNLFDLTKIDAIESRVETLETSAISTRTTTGEADGALISVTAKGHAEQDGTPTPSDPKEIRVVRGHEVTGKTGRYVDLVVTADGTTTTTPIPLPSRGWVGSLPDGTHDALTIDGAGKVSWVLTDAEVVLDGSESGWSVQSPPTHKRFANNMLANIIKRPSSTSVLPNVLSSHFPQSTSGDSWTKDNPSIAVETSGLLMLVNPSITELAAWQTWLQANPVTVLYPLATQTTESMGYVDLPDIPDGAVVSMPELEDLGVESWNNDVIYRYVNALVARVDQ